MESVFLSSQPAALDVKEVWFSNMHLLGLRPDLCEEQYKVTLERNMFDHINKRGSEAVLHFLFTKLDPKLSSEVFRDCWPVYDKKLEQHFRRACSNWLASLSKESPLSKLPRMPASLLMSPGGEKFYLFLMRFSTHVMKNHCIIEAKTVGKHLFLSPFVVSSRGYEDCNPAVAQYAMQAHMIRHSNSIQQRAHLACTLHHEWETYASQLTAEYRQLSKEMKTLTKKLESVKQDHKQRELTSTPQRRMQSGNQAKDDKVLTLSADISSKKRTLRIQKAREMWKMFDMFQKSTGSHQEVMEGVVQGTAEMYAVDAKDISFQLPEMILQEYEALKQEEGREGANANTYQAGKLNLLCLMEMWKCSLRVIKDEVLRAGLPDFEQELGYTNAGIRNHRAHLTAATNLRASLVGLKSSLEESIQQLEAELKEQRNAPLSSRGGKGPSLPEVLVPEITIPALGLELLPPTPRKTGTPKTPHYKMEQASFWSNSQTVSTPDAVRDISLSVHQTSRLHNQTLPASASQIPVAARKHSSLHSQSLSHHHHHQPLNRDLTNIYHASSPLLSAHHPSPKGTQSYHETPGHRKPHSTRGTRRPESQTPLSQGIKSQDLSTRKADPPSASWLNVGAGGGKGEGEGKIPAPPVEVRQATKDHGEMSPLLSVNVSRNLSTPLSHSLSALLPHLDTPTSHDTPVSRLKESVSTPTQTLPASLLREGSFQATPPVLQSQKDAIKAAPLVSWSQKVVDKATPPVSLSKKEVDAPSPATPPKETKDAPSHSIPATLAPGTPPSPVRMTYVTPNFTPSPPSKGNTEGHFPFSNGGEPSSSHRKLEFTTPPHSSITEGSQQLSSAQRAHEKLADQIAAAVSNLNESEDSFQDSPAQLHAVLDPVAAMGREAFVSHDLIGRSPSGEALPRRCEDSESSKTPAISTNSRHKMALVGSSPLDFPDLGAMTLNMTDPSLREEMPDPSSGQEAGGLSKLLPPTPSTLSSSHTGNENSKVRGDVSHGKQVGPSHTPKGADTKDRKESPFTSATPTLFSQEEISCSSHIGKDFEEHTVPSHERRGTMDGQEKLFSSATPSLNPRSDHTAGDFEGLTGLSCKEGGTMDRQELLFTSATPTLNPHVAGDLTGLSCKEGGTMDRQELLFTSATPTLYSHTSRIGGDFGHLSGLSRNLLSSPSLGAAGGDNSTRLPLPYSSFQTPSGTQPGLSFLNDIQPPTPFQHAVFDLDVLDSPAPTSTASNRKHNQRERGEGQETNRTPSLSQNKKGRTKETVVSSLIDFSSPGKDTPSQSVFSQNVSSPLFSVASYKGSEHSISKSVPGPLPSYLFSSNRQEESSSNNDQSSHGLSFKRSDLGLLGDGGLPELVPVYSSGSESPPELSLSIETESQQK